MRRAANATLGHLSSIPRPIPALLHIFQGPPIRVLPHTLRRFHRRALLGLANVPALNLRHVSLSVEALFLMVPIPLTPIIAVEPLLAIAVLSMTVVLVRHLLRHPLTLDRAHLHILRSHLRRQRLAIHAWRPWNSTSLTAHSSTSWVGLTAAIVLIVLIPIHLIRNIARCVHGHILVRDVGRVGGHHLTLGTCHLRRARWWAIIGLTVVRVDSWTLGVVVVPTVLGLDRWLKRWLVVVEVERRRWRGLLGLLLALMHGVGADGGPAVRQGAVSVGGALLADLLLD